MAVGEQPVGLPQLADDLLRGVAASLHGVLLPVGRSDSHTSWTNLTGSGQVARRRIASVIIAAAGFLAVPVEIFTALDFSTGAYGIYRLWVFVAVAFLLPVAVPFPWWLLTDYDRENARRRTANAMTGVLLTYCAIRCSSDD
jgi:hypothetical protein